MRVLKAEADLDLLSKVGIARPAARGGSVTAWAYEWYRAERPFDARFLVPR